MFARVRHLGFGPTIFAEGSAPQWAVFRGVCRDGAETRELVVSWLMNDERFHRISKALADPRRLQILERIAAADEVACATLVSKFPVTQATMSHHLKELANAGLIKMRRQAKFCFYRQQRRVWAEYLAALNERIPVSPRRS